MAGIIFTGVVGADAVREAGADSASQAGAAIGTGLGGIKVTGILGVVSFFAGIILLVIASFGLRSPRSTAGA